MLLALNINVHTRSAERVLLSMPKVTWLPNLHGFILKVQTCQPIKAPNEAFFFLLLGLL